MFKTYPNCFIGSDCVKFLVTSNTVSSEAHAIQLGKILVKNKIIQHVTGDHDFKNENLFYCFVNQKPKISKVETEAKGKSILLTTPNIKPTKTSNSKKSKKPQYAQSSLQLPTFDDKNDEDDDDEEVNTNIHHDRMRSLTVHQTYKPRSQKAVLKHELKDRIRKKKSDISELHAIAIDSIYNEIIETEETYLNGLKVICDEFLYDFFESKLIKIEHKNLITSNLPQILQFHSMLFKKLLQLKDEKKLHEIPNIFKDQYIHSLKLYIHYVNDYGKILDLISSLTKSDKKLREYLKHKRKNEKKTLANYFILPIQRIPRYLLLLNELKKEYSKNKKNKVLQEKIKVIDAAIENISKIANRINDRQKEIENMSMCLTIQNQLKNLKNIKIVEPARQYVKTFSFDLVEKKKNKSRQLFVFNDIIIVSNKTWKFKNMINLRSTSIKRDKKIDPYCFVMITNLGTMKFQAFDISKINEFEKIVKQYRSLVFDADISHLDKSGKTAEIRKNIRDRGVTGGNLYRSQVSNKVEFTSSKPTD